jgi:hypothetical protein
LVLGKTSGKKISAGGENKKKGCKDEKGTLHIFNIIIHVYELVKL